MEILSLGNTLLVAVVGIMVVFLGLLLLMLLIKLMGMLTGNTARKVNAKPAAAPAAAPVAAAAPAVVASLIQPDTKVKAAKIDDETVAVLTAAIAAVRGEGYPFKIRRIVRVNKG